MKNNRIRSLDSSFLLEIAQELAATVSIMEKGRVEAFTDGVFAIVITIMVLEIKVPDGATLESLERSVPILLTYALSFANVAIFWNNHHHMFQASRHVNGKVLWANMFLLFWMSLVPFVIRWIDQTHFAPLPTASYGVVLALSSVGYVLLERTLIACNGPESRLAQAVGIDMKAIVSMAIYAVAIPLSWVHPWIAIALYAINALAWFAPDRRIEKVASPSERD